MIRGATRGSFASSHVQLILSDGLTAYDPPHCHLRFSRAREPPPPRRLHKWAAVHRVWLSNLDQGQSILRFTSYHRLPFSFWNNEDVKMRQIFFCREDTYYAASQAGSGTTISRWGGGSRIKLHFGQRLFIPPPSYN